MIRRLAYCAISAVAAGIGYTAGRLATPPDRGLAGENRRLRRALAKVEQHAAQLSAQVGEYQHERSKP